MCSGCEAKRLPSLNSEKGDAFIEERRCFAQQGYSLCRAGSSGLALLVKQNSSEKRKGHSRNTRIARSSTLGDSVRNTTPTRITTRGA